jgi:hypothetical protein
MAACGIAMPQAANVPVVAHFRKKTVDTGGPDKLLSHLSYGLFSVPAPPVRTRERRGFFIAFLRHPRYN